MESIETAGDCPIKIVERQNCMELGDIVEANMALVALDFLNQRMVLKLR